MTITAAVRSANASSIRLIVKSLTGRGRVSRRNRPISVIDAGFPPRTLLPDRDLPAAPSSARRMRVSRAARHDDRRRRPSRLRALDPDPVEDVVRRSVYDPRDDELVGREQLKRKAPARLIERP